MNSYNKLANKYFLQYYDEKPLDTKAYARCAMNHYSDPIHLNIRELLLSHVFSDDPKIFQVNEDGTNTEGKIGNGLRMRLPAWTQSLREALKEIWVMGIVAVDMSGSVPHVFSRGLGESYQITTRYDYESARQQFRFYRQITNAGNWVLDPHVFIMTGFGSNPASDGALSSIEYSVLSHEETWRMNDLFNTQVGFANAYRSDYVEFPAQEQSFTDVYHNDLSFRIPDPTRADPRATRHAAGTQLRHEEGGKTREFNTVDRENLQGFQKRIADYVGHQYHIDHNGLSRPETNLVHLMPGGKIAAQTSAIMRHDTEEQNRRREDYLLAAFGIQHSEVFSTKLHRLGSSVTAQSSDRALSNTINRWRNYAGMIFTFWDSFSNTAKRIKNLNKTGQQVDIPSAIPTNYLIVFPMRVTTTMEALRVLSDSGGLTESGFIESVHQLTGISRESIIMPKSQHEKDMELAKLNAKAHALDFRKRKRDNA